MRILDYMERLQTLTRLLKKEHTGSLTQMARNMGVHRLMTKKRIHIISRNHLISN